MRNNNGACRCAPEPPLKPSGPGAPTSHAPPRGLRCRGRTGEYSALQDPAAGSRSGLSREKKQFKLENYSESRASRMYQFLSVRFFFSALLTPRNNDDGQKKIRKSHAGRDTAGRYRENGAHRRRRRRRSSRNF